MKNKILILLACTALLAGCHQPEYVKPTTTALGLNSVSAQFTQGNYAYNSAAIFSTAVSNLTDDIVIKVPYYFPEDSDNQVDESLLKTMRMTAAIDYNCTIKPNLVLLDLTQNNEFTFTDGRGEAHTIHIRGEIVKMSGNDFLAFQVLSPEMTCLLDNKKSTITLTYNQTMDLSKCTVDFTLSPHATCSISVNDIVDFTKLKTITVTAQDGTKHDYSIVLSDVTPVKISYGYRTGSEKQLFNLDMENLGLVRAETRNTSLAVLGSYLVISSGDGTTPIYLNKTTGAKVGEINIGSATSDGFVKNDQAGHMLICNHSNTDFKIWTTTSVTEAPSLLLEYATTTGYALGGKLAVQGNVKGNAIIAAPYEGNDAGTINQVAIWVIQGGVISDPQIITLSGFIGLNWAKGYWGQSDGMPAFTPISANISDGFLFSVYDENLTYLVNGTTFAMSSLLTPLSDASNFNYNNWEVREFNKARYGALLITGYFPAWGGAPTVYVYDMTSMSNVTGTVSGASSLAMTITGNSHYDQGGGTGGNTRSAGDVVLYVSNDGYYMNLYYIDQNNRIIEGYQVDCIKQ
jgi:hypothetical protein